jgi:hypothetical protein
MTTIVQTQGQFDRSRSAECSTDANLTRSLLGYLALAGTFYVVVSLVQALTQSGFSLSCDVWSLLALGRPGWIQQVNLVMTGAMTIACAIGVRRALSRSADARLWGPRLLTGYGVALISAGIFAPIPPMGSRPALPAALRACGRLSRRRSRIHCRLRRDCHRSDERSDQPGLHGCRRC